jgi:glutaryl-CoA dehydrogenase
MAAWMIDAFGSSELRQRVLPDLCSMAKFASYCLTEPDSGSDAASLKTRAVRDGDEYVIDGAKRWIGNGTVADVVVVWARDEADNKVKGFVVEKGTPGFTATKIERKMALRTVQNADIVLADCRVPEANRLQKARGFRDTAEVLRRTRAGVAWQSVGIMMGAYENALQYAKTRKQFGKPIAGFQLVQDLLVRMLGNLTTSLGLVVRLAQAQDEGVYHDEHSALAKAVCTYRMHEAVGWAREILGGNGRSS